MSLRQLRRVRWAVRAVLMLGVAASVAANILHADPNPIAQAIAAWPPLALLLTVELISRVPVHRRSLAAVRLGATATIAGIAAWVSYWHMAGVAARYGETGAAPYLLPLSRRRPRRGRERLAGRARRAVAVVSRRSRSDETGRHGLGSDAHVRVRPGHIGDRGAEADPRSAARRADRRTAGCRPSPPPHDHDGRHRPGDRERPGPRSFSTTRPTCRGDEAARRRAGRPAARRDHRRPREAARHLDEPPQARARQNLVSRVASSGAAIVVRIRHSGRSEHACPYPGRRTSPPVTDAGPITPESLVKIAV